MFIIFESSILYIVGSAGRGPYAAGKESETFHIRQAGLPGLKCSGRGPGASSVDHSPPLPPSVIIESGRALAADYVPGALEVPRPIFG